MCIQYVYIYVYILCICIYTKFDTTQFSSLVLEISPCLLNGRCKRWGVWLNFSDFMAVRKLMQLRPFTN